jgi:hypothetical protein
MDRGCQDNKNIPSKKIAIFIQNLKEMQQKYLT